MPSLTARRRLPVVVAAAAAATTGFASGMALAVAVNEAVVDSDPVMSAAMFVGGGALLALLAIFFDILVVQLASPEPLPGAGLWAAMRNRWQGDRTEKEFAHAFRVVVFCLGAITVFAVMAFLPIEVFVGVIVALAAMWAGSRIVTICRDADYRLSRSLVSAALQGAFFGFILFYFTG